ncbi:MAG: dienelactone hydrolase family protein [Nitrospirae bacterium]|nr:dienelactone hydrolase family protein [Nitrospirota bacterium]MDA1304598.1 dienelactone hydrolase family protein [Nitrospirota bacterium]
MSERVTPYTVDQIGFNSVRFSSKGVFDTHKDKMVDPYAQTRIPKEAQVEGVQFFPQVPGIFPSIVLLHERWGLNGQIKDFAIRLAREGYVVFLPNLYGRQGGMITANAEVADALVERMDHETVLKDINASCEWLNTNITEDALLDLTKRNFHAIIGFGIGGTLAIKFSCRRKRLRAAISFYGKPPSQLDLIQNLYCPLLYHAAEKDDTVSAEELEEMKKTAEEAGKSLEIVTYPGTTHSFFNEGQADVYHAESANKAWGKTIAFIDKALQV